MRKNINGSVTVEAALSLSFFIFGYIFILSLVNAVRTESAVQYGINHTAQELSQYCYIADKLSVSSNIQNSNITVGEAVENICGLPDTDSTDAYDTDGAGIIGGLIDAFTGDITICGIAAEPFCKLIIPRYIAGDRKSSDEYLKKLAGITVDDIDFRHSSLLKDGKTIEIVAVYNVYLKTFGLFGKDGIRLSMKNTAATAAWCTGKMTDSETENGEESKWKLGNFQRGQAWIAEIKAEHPNDSVKSGKGIDLYKKGTYTMIISVNVFDKTYSECEKFGSGYSSDYALKENAVKRLIGKYADKLNTCITEKSSSLETESGFYIPEYKGEKSGVLMVVVPLEAGEDKDISAALERIADNIYKEKKVKVQYEYREKALSETGRT